MPDPGSTRLVAGRVFDGYRMHTPGWVVLAGDRVAQVAGGLPDDLGDGELRPDLVVAPGFVDTHLHGGGGGSFGAPAPGPERTVATHRRHGTTTMFASLVTAKLPALVEQVARVAPLVGTSGLAGIHLEGPWLSPDFRGAHTAGDLATPDPADVRRVLDAAGGTVRMVTVAPELPGGLDLVRQLTDAGVAAAVGHTGCTYDQATAAVAAGARVATHLFNAMPSLHHRAPGPVLALLDDASVLLEVIADGVHVHDALLRRLLTTGDGRVALVSDAMAATALGDGTYHLGDRVVDVVAGQARLAGTRTLAGSTSTLHAMVRHAVVDAGVDLAVALRAATSTPADAHALTAGRLSPGRPADVVVMNADLDLVTVYAAGVPVAPEDG